LELQTGRFPADPKSFRERSNSSSPAPEYFPGHRGILFRGSGKSDEGKNKSSSARGKLPGAWEEFPECSEKFSETSGNFPEPSANFPESPEKFPEPLDQFSRPSEEFPEPQDKFPEGRVDESPPVDGLAAPLEKNAKERFVAGDARPR
jgi:hypothetical protein